MRFFLSRSSGAVVLTFTAHLAAQVSSAAPANPPPPAAAQQTAVAPTAVAPAAVPSAAATSSQSAASPAPASAPAPLAATPQAPAPSAKAVGNLTASASTEQVRGFLAARPELGCDYQSHVNTERRVFVACGDAGVVVLTSGSEGFVVAEQRPVSGGRAVGFFEQADAIWVRVVEQRALQVGTGRITARSDAPSAAATLPTGSTPFAPTVPGTPHVSPKATAAAGNDVTQQGRVLTVRDRIVTINLGHEQGVKLSDRFAFLRPAAVVRDEYLVSSKPAVVGIVVDVAPGTALLRIGFHEEVHPGDRAALTSASATASRINPPRVADVWELSALIRPGLSIGTAGGFVAAELEAGRRLQRWYYGINVSPLGIAGVRGQNLIAIGSGHIYGAFDGQAFAAGIGVGITGVNDTDGTPGGTGLSIHELLRIGAYDGLNLTIRSSLAIFRSEIDFANVDVRGQVAVASDAWLVLRGGGGVVGYGYGELAVRALTSGNGGPGSSFLQVGVGGSGSYVSTCSSLDVGFGGSCTSYSVAGPHLTVGMEWRL